jgi:hypothetical protein
MWDEDLGARRAVPSFFPFYFLFYFFISFGFIYGALILPFLFHLNRPPPSVSFSARLGPDDRLGSRAPDHMGTPVADPVGPYGNTSSQSQSLLVSCRRRLPSPSPIAGCVLRWIGGYAPPSPPPHPPSFSSPREGRRKANTKWLKCPTAG